MSELLFVYGTLKRGYCRSYVLQDAKYLGEVSTQANYALYDLGDYPGIVHEQGAGMIKGELYQVCGAMWSQLDEVEGVEIGLFHRDEVVLSDQHENAVATAYFYSRSVDGHRRCGESWS